MRVAVMDDWQGVAAASADWSALRARADVVIMAEPFADEQAAAAALADFNIILPMRERTPLPGSLLARLPKLRMIAMTGHRSPSLDIKACTERGVVISNTEGATSSNGTAELALALMLAVARRIPAGDAAIRAGRFQEGVGIGPVMEGKTLGVIALGRIGGRVARYAQALDMRVLAWSRSLTKEAAAAGGAEDFAASKEDLLAQSDVVSLHVPLSPSSRGLIGAAEIARMKPGAILINTSRAPLVDQGAMLQALHEGRIMAGLDVYEQEPLPPNDPIRTAPNTVLTPHIGYGSSDTFLLFYRQCIENILAFLDGKPIRVLNPEALA